MEINKDIIIKTVEKLKLRIYDHTEDWVNKYNELSDSQKEHLISYFNKAQADYIKDCMTEVRKPIPLVNLGTFWYKDARKDFYDIKAEYPDMSIQEIITEVKQRYWNRVLKEKALKTLRKNRSKWVIIRK